MSALARNWIPSSLLFAPTWWISDAPRSPSNSLATKKKLKRLSRWSAPLGSRKSCGREKSRWREQSNPATITIGARRKRQENSHESLLRSRRRLESSSREEDRYHRLWEPRTRACAEFARQRDGRSRRPPQGQREYREGRKKRPQSARHHRSCEGSRHHHDAGSR